jgi:HEAT repeat protein
LAILVPAVGTSARGQAPGPELFAKEPRTPLELWDAVDYLVRTDQAKKAVPYLDKFVKANPDERTLIAIRNRYGAGSILQLGDHDATRPYVQPLIESLVKASREFAIRPERIARFVSELTGTADERAYAVRHLREAGPDAIPPLVEALSRPDLSEPDRRLIVDSIGRLDRSVIPPLAAVLDSPDPKLAADAALALGLIGDRSAIAPLTFAAVSPDTAPPVRLAAQEAVAKLSQLPFAAQPRNPSRVLSDAAWRYHRHQVELPEPARVWSWDQAKKSPVSQSYPRNQAEAILGDRLVKKALKLDPINREAQIAEVSLALESAIARAGSIALSALDPATVAAAKAKDPSVLGDALKTAIADGKPDLAAVVASVLGEASDQSALAKNGPIHPLVEALYAPGRRTEFAAARAIVNLKPMDAFAGSSRVVPVLARFLKNQAMSHAVVIDANPTRGSQLAGLLISLGYDAELELTGQKGFTAAAETSDVEVILISYDLFGRGWSLNDTLANLGADSRTKLIPIYVYGPLNVQYMRPSLERDYPGLRYVVHPRDPETLKKQLLGLPAPLGAEERAGYAREAAQMLAWIASKPNGPLAADLGNAELAMTSALNNPQAAVAAATALGDVADLNAQRSLLAAVLDPAQAPALRKVAAERLVQSIHRFGPLVTANQEALLALTLREEADPDFLANVVTVANALRPPRLSGSKGQPVGRVAPGRPTGAQSPAAPVSVPEPTGAKP